MEGRLGKTTRHPIMKVLVDFENVGYDLKDQWVDITDDILEINGSKEKSGKQIGSITSDIATFTVDNTDKKFSNDNTNSSLFGKIKTNLKFRLLTGFQGETLVPYASGYIETFAPSWRDKRVSIKATDYFKLFKEEAPPEESFQDISWDALVNVLCDHVGLPSFIVRNIPQTEFYYSYFRFEEDNCFESLKSLMEVAVGEAYFEQEQFFVKTKLALDYQLDTAIDHDITVDDLFDFEENVDGQNIINTLSISSQYKAIGPLEVVFDTPENVVKVDNELMTYDGSGSVYVDSNNLPIVHAEDIPMQLTNITQRKNIQTNGHEPLTGRITIHPDSLVDVAVGDTLSLSYSYQQLAILSGKTRKYTFILKTEVDSLQTLDIAVWDENGNVRREYSQTADDPNTVSRQGMTFDPKTNTVTLTLKNNYNSPVVISTMQLNGYPIKILAPIEVFVRDLPSVDEFGRKEVSLQNNYINNIRLAEKIGQYIVDNNKGNRKRINIEIPAYPEFSLDDISKVTEASSGTSHSFTNERIDYTYTNDSGWSVKAALLELDTAPWVYESFKGESWEKTNSGAPDSDFLKDIFANLIKNGGAELYTGFSNKEDIGAVNQLHIVPDYWNFERLSGDATSRIRDGGNLVLHGLHSFEITTTNSGTGYYEQIVNSVKTDSTYVLSLVADPTSCSGRASVLQYADDVLLQTDSIDIPIDGVYELMISSLASTNAIVVRIEKLAGTTGVESLVFDKVKFENGKEKTPYIENEETSSIQIGQRYANSVVIGNDYGIEILDDQNNSRVRIGQYRPNEYGIQIFQGAIEFVGGLPEDQLDPDATGKWNDASSWIINFASDSSLTPFEKREIALEWAKLTFEYNSLISQAALHWPDTEVVAERDSLVAAYNDLDEYLNITPDAPNGLPILGSTNMDNTSVIVRDAYTTKFEYLYTTLSNIRLKITGQSKNNDDAIQEDVSFAEKRVADAELKILNGSIVATVMNSTEYLTSQEGKADLSALAQYATQEGLDLAKEDLKKDTDEKIAGLDFTPYVTQNQLTIEASNLTSQFKKGGGINVLRNSVGFAGFEFFTTIGTDMSTIQGDELDKMGFGSGFLCYESAEAKSFSQGVYLTNGLDYTLSGYVKRQSGAGSILIIITTTDDLSYVELPLTPAGEGYEFFSITFEATVDMGVKIYFDANVSAVVTGLMLNIGNQPFSWSMAAGELYNTAVRMDLKGITVSQIEDGKSIGQTVMTPTKFAGYFDVNGDGIIDESNGSPDEVFRMDKDEFVMKKAVVKDAVTMGSVKIVNVISANNSGWAFVPNE